MKSLYDQIQELKQIPTPRTYKIMCSAEERAAVDTRAAAWKALSGAIKDTHVQLAYLELTDCQSAEIPVVEAKLDALEHARTLLKQEYWNRNFISKETV